MGLQGSRQKLGGGARARACTGVSLASREYRNELASHGNAGRNWPPSIAQAAGLGRGAAQKCRDVAQYPLELWRHTDSRPTAPQRTRVLPILFVCETGCAEGRVVP